MFWGGSCAGAFLWNYKYWYQNWFFNIENLSSNHWVKRKIARQFIQIDYILLGWSRKIHTKNPSLLKVLRITGNFKVLVKLSVKIRSKWGFLKLFKTLWRHHSYFNPYNRRSDQSDTRPIITKFPPQNAPKKQHRNKVSKYFFISILLNSLLS